MSDAASVAPLSPVFSAEELVGMPAPLLFLSTAILFWGWQSQQLAIAVGMATLVITADGLRRYAGVSWHLSDRDFNRLADLTTLLWVLTALYLFNKESINGLFSLLTWFPLLVFLLLSAQLFSSQQHLPLSALFWSLRQSANPARKPLSFLSDTRLQRMRIDLSYPYVIVCLLSASVAQHAWFFFGICVFFTWGFWHIRPRRYPLALWLTFALLASGLGYLGQSGIQQLQHGIERWVMDWFEDQLWRSRDPYQQNTRIGDIGELKLSNQILFRVQAPAPVLLREATYDYYQQQNWRAQQVDFNPLPESSDTNGWFLTPKPEHRAAPPTAHLSISLYLPQKQGILPLPNNSFYLSALRGLEFRQNRFDGALKLDNAPSLLNYSLDYSESALPTPIDLQGSALLNIPEREAKLLQALADELQLQATQLTEPQKIARIEAFFADNFHYALAQTAGASFATPLQRFLRETRAGHCEYFATATVLLLRAAGIPSRYAVGYAVQEYSFFENAYLVRRRHAHAWAQAYVAGHWQDVDTTPGDWLESEAKAAGKEHLSDFWAWLKHRIDQWRWQESNSDQRQLLWWLLPLVLLLLWRLSLHKKYQRRSRLPAAAPLPDLPRPGLDSPFYTILNSLQAQGYVRAPGQTLHDWLKHLPSTAQTSLRAHAALPALLAWHNRYRFHPNGLSHAEKAQFNQQVQAWLAQQPTNKTA